MRILLRLLPLALALQLIACGGSSGSGETTTTSPPTSTSPTTQPTAQDQANAKAASLTAALSLDSGLATLAWTDTFTSTSGYAIQQQTDTNTWTTIDTVPGQGGNNQAITWSRAVNVTQTLRVQAVETNYNVSLQTAGGQSQVQIAVPATRPTIVLSQTQPVSGQVQISVSNASGYSSVAYFIDLRSLSTSTSGPNFPVSWNTATFTSGQHLVLAQLQANSDFSVQLRESVQVTNSEVAVSFLTGFPPAGGIPPPPGLGPPTITSGSTLQIAATSPAGIQSVTLSMDGSVIGTLSAPNDATGTNIYDFSITAVSGSHTLSAVALDNASQSATATATYIVSNPPKLSVSSPVDGALVNGTLNVSGTSTSDKSGAVTTTAVLGSVQILHTTTSSFATNFSLSGVVPGDYTLTVTSTDSTGSTASQSFIITVTSSPSLVYSPVATVGPSGQLLTTDSTAALIQIPDDSVHLLSGGADTVIATGQDRHGYSQWALSNGNAFALTSTSNNVDLVYWNASGTRTDLGAVGAFNSDYIANLVSLHWPWALTYYWTVPTGSATGTATYTFFNAQTGQTLTPPIQDMADGAADFFTAPSGLTLYYPTIPSSATGLLPIGISSWVQSSNQITSLASDPSLREVAPQTDGTRVAWRSAALAATTPPYSLIAYGIASSNQTALSTTMSKFQLADGTLAWAESGSNTTYIKASDGTTTTTISSLTSSVFYGTGGGYVLFGEASKLYIWSAAGGRQVILDAVPGVATISGKTVYFTNGAQQLLYSVTLN